MQANVDVARRVPHVNALAPRPPLSRAFFARSALRWSCDTDDDLTVCDVFEEYGAQVSVWAIVMDGCAQVGGQVAGSGMT